MLWLHWSWMIFCLMGEWTSPKIMEHLWSLKEKLEKLKSNPANVINHKNIALLFEDEVIHTAKKNDVLIYAVQLNSHKAWSTTTKRNVSDMAILHWTWNRNRQYTYLWVSKHSLRDIHIISDMVSIHNIITSWCKIRGINIYKHRHNLYITILRDPKQMQIFQWTAFCAISSNRWARQSFRNFLWIETCQSLCLMGMFKVQTKHCLQNLWVIQKIHNHISNQDNFL